MQKVKPFKLNGGNEVKSYLNFGRSVVLPLLLLGVAAASAAGRGSSAGDKIKADELVAKHLEAVGPAAARGSVKSLIAVGEVVVNFGAPSPATFGGRAVIASSGDKSMVGMNFPSPNYPQEKFGFDGREVTAGYVRPGVRSSLSDFLLNNGVILKQGLLGGTLSRAWPLLDLAARGAKLEYDGTKKINGRAAHEFSYTPRGGSDLQISLFFDAETFQHLRTEYTRIVSAQLGSSIDKSAQQRTTRSRMVEDFSDFKKEGDLTLPHSYKILLELETPRGNFRSEWSFTATQFLFNRVMGADSFNMNTDSKD